MRRRLYQAASAATGARAQAGGLAEQAKGKAKATGKKGVDEAAHRAPAPAAGVVKEHGGAAVTAPPPPRPPPTPPPAPAR